MPAPNPIDDLLLSGKRFFQIGAEEVSAGIKQVKENLPSLRQGPRLVLPQSINDIKRIGKIGQGALRAVYSPVTAFWRSFYGEPAKNTAKSLGASDTTAEFIGIGVETAGYLLGSVGAAKIAQGIVPQNVQQAEKIVNTLLPKIRKDLPGPEQILEKVNETKLAGTDVGPILRKINTPQDAKNVFQNIVKAVEPEVLSARRGVVTWDQTESAAKLLATTPQKLMKRKVGQAFNATELEGLKFMLRKSTEEVTAAAKTALTGSEQDLLAFKALRDKYVAVAQNFMGARAEAGRALNILKKEMSPLEQGVLPKLTGETVDLLRKQAKMVSEAPSAEAAAEAMLKATTADKVTEAWINMLLSGPQTHATNILSNTLTSLITIPEHFLASAIGKLHGGQKVFFRESIGRLYGWVEGARDGIRLARQTFLSETPSDVFSKIETGTMKSIPGKFGKAVRVPGRLLMAEDEFFKSIGYRMELQGRAINTAINEGKSGRALAQRVKELISNPSTDLHLAGIDEARYLTFTKPLGEFGRSILKVKHSHPAVNIIMPFVRTPVNIVKFAGERTPLAPFSKVIRNSIEKGGRERDLAIARIALGSMAGGVTAWHAAQGLITGGGPSDPVARSMKYNTGWQPYSLKIGDQYYSYARLEPLGILLGVSADFAEIAGAATSQEKENVGALIAASISKNLTSKTWLRGLSDVVEALSDPDRYGKKYIANLAGTVIPTGIAQITRVMDPTLREARTIIDKIKSRTPNYSKTLPPRLNIWGEPITLEGGWGPDLISPVYVSTDKHDKLADEIVRLKLNPGLPNRKFNGVELTPTQYNEFITFSGQPARRVLDRLVHMPEYDRLPDKVKADLISRQIRRWREYGRIRMISKYPQQLYVKPKTEQLH